MLIDKEEMQRLARKRKERLEGFIQTRLQDVTPTVIWCLRAQFHGPKVRKIFRRLWGLERSGRKNKLVFSAKVEAEASRHLDAFYNAHPEPELFQPYDDRSLPSTSQRDRAWRIVETSVSPKVRADFLGLIAAVYGEEEHEAVARLVVADLEALEGSTELGDEFVRQSLVSHSLCLMLRDPLVRENLATAMWNYAWPRREYTTHEKAVSVAVRKYMTLMGQEQLPKMEAFLEPRVKHHVRYITLSWIYCVLERRPLAATVDVTSLRKRVHELARLYSNRDLLITTDMFILCQAAYNAAVVLGTDPERTLTRQFLACSVPALGGLVIKPLREALQQWQKADPPVDAQEIQDLEAICVTLEKHLEEKTHA